MSPEQRIGEAARRQGFVLVGFAALHKLEGREEFYARWLAEQRHGAMDYLAREPERRLDPRTLDPRLRSVVSLGYPYDAPPRPSIVDWRTELRGRIAAYALGADYHGWLLRKARTVAETITSIHPGGAVTRVYVDTGPVLEREWGTEAGLGWFGKNTMLLNRDHGSYFFLCEIFTDLKLEPNSKPARDHCGTCRQCLDLCPTNALMAGYLMNSKLCISYLTIENRGPIPLELRPELGNWIFGCDICQEVCPWNDHRTPRVCEDDLAPRLPELMALDENGFRQRYGRSAVKRAKRRGLLRSVAVALGNSGNRDAIAPLARALENDPEPLVRGHAAWALGRLGGGAARKALELCAAREQDSWAGREIAAALEQRAGG
jgi:epoxyqueuosine reductase